MEGKEGGRGRRKEGREPNELLFRQSPPPPCHCVTPHSERHFGFGHFLSIPTVKYRPRWKDLPTVGLRYHVLPVQ